MQKWMSRTETAQQMAQVTQRMASTAHGLLIDIDAAVGSDNDATRMAP